MSSPIEAANSLTRETTRVRALFEGHEIADSDDVLALHEGDRHPVLYFPRKDVWMIFLSQTDTVAHANAKGAATYFTILRDQHIVERVAWAHDTPAPELHALVGRIAFSSEHVEFKAADQSAADAPGASEPEEERE